MLSKSTLIFGLVFVTVCLMGAYADEAAEEGAEGGDDKEGKKGLIHNMTKGVGSTLGGMANNVANGVEKLGDGDLKGVWNEAFGADDVGGKEGQQPPQSQNTVVYRYHKK